MRAWMMWYENEWCVLVLAETVIQGKILFCAEAPIQPAFDTYGWTDIRLRREPAFDGISTMPKMFDGSDGEPHEFWARFREPAE